MGEGIAGIWAGSQVKMEKNPWQGWREFPGDFYGDSVQPIYPLSIDYWTKEEISK
jgi:hypothetical protein